jgi:hypothetical protein
MAEVRKEGATGAATVRCPPVAVEAATLAPPSAPPNRRALIAPDGKKGGLRP